MNKKLMNEKLTKNNYGKLVDSIMEAFKGSNKEKYFFLSLKIEELKGYVNLSILDKEGKKQEYEEVILEENKDYIDAFLKELVDRLEKECKITKKDIVNLDGDNFVAFRLITNYNDLITIDGLTEEKANNLLKKDKADAIIQLFHTDKIIRCSATPIIDKKAKLIEINPEIIKILLTGHVDTDILVVTFTN